MRPPARRMRSAVIPVAALILWVGSARAGDPGESVSDATRWFTRFTHYGVAFSAADGMDAASGFAVVSTDPSRIRPLRLDIGAPLVEVFRFDDEERLHFAADPVVFLATAIPLVAMFEYCQSCDSSAKVLLGVLAPAWLPLVRPTAVWQPVRWAGLGVGYDSEYVFLAEDKGVSFRPFAGLQIDLGDVGRMELGVQENWLWNWRRDSRDLGSGVFARLSISTDFLGGGVIPEPTPP